MHHVDKTDPVSTDNSNMLLN